MSDEPRDVRLPVLVSKSEAAAIEEFRLSEQLESRAEAIRLLLEIALDAVNQGGNRFWDKNVTDQPKT